MRLFPEWICLFQNTSVCLVVLHAASRGISACLHCSLRKIGKSFGGSSRRPGRDTECDWWKKTWMEDSLQLWWRLASGISDPAGNYKKVMVMFHRLINVVIAGTHKRSGWGLGYDPFALLTPAEAFSLLKDDVSGKAWRFPRFITMWQDSSPFLSFWVVVEFRRFHELNDSLRSDQLHRWQWPSDPFPSWNLRNLAPNWVQPAMNPQKPRLADLGILQVPMGSITIGFPRSQPVLKLDSYIYIYNIYI